MLNSRAVAMQGIGFGVLLMAAQGLLSVEVELTPVWRPPAEGVNLLSRVYIDPIEYTRFVRVTVTVDGEEFSQEINMMELNGSVQAFESLVQNRVLEGRYSVKVISGDTKPKRFS